MKNFKSIMWGLVLITLGIIIGLNAFEIINVDIFFDGWWTLFIIVPCFIGIITEKDKRYHKIHLALTGSNRGDRHNRDMLIDSSLLGVDGTAELIEEVAKKVFHE